MGNCFRHEKSASVAVWPHDDRGSVASKYKHGDEDNKTGHYLGINSNSEKKGLLGGRQAGGLSMSPSTRELKITISRKELEELVQKMDSQGLSLEQALARMVNNIDGDGGFEVHHHRPWRPVLQSIPE